MRRTSFRTYARELIEDFPRYAVLAHRRWGRTGLHIACIAYVARSSSRGVESPIGKIGTHSELVNFLDNFCADELRCKEVESFLEEKHAALVVDVGVNVGVSVRWWLCRSSTLRVIGVDMVSEALAFTSTRIADLGFTDRWTVIQSAVGDYVGVTQFGISDPLDGTTSLLAKSGATSREVPITTLDNLLKMHGDSEIDLLKLDIEGYAGLALEAADETLRRTRYVCVECHGNTETESSSRALTRSCFTLFKVGGRHMWWRR